MKRLGLVWSLVGMLASGAHGLDWETLVLRSDLIVKGTAVANAPWIKVLPAQSWYKKQGKDKFMVMGAIRLSVDEVLKGQAPKGEPLIAVYGAKTFKDDMKQKQTGAMSDFPKITAQHLGVPMIWFLEWDENAKSYALKGEDRAASSAGEEEIKGLIKQDAATVNTGDAPKTERKSGWAKLTPDVLEGVVESADDEKGLLILEVPKFNVAGSAALEGKWTLVLPKWFYGADAVDSDLTAKFLRKGHPLRVVTRPGTSEEPRERNALMIERLRGGKAMAQFEALLGKEEPKWDRRLPKGPAPTTPDEEKEAPEPAPED